MRGRQGGPQGPSVMLVHVLPKSSVATTSCRQLEGSETRQRRTIATPKDLDTSWKASTLVVGAAGVGDAEGDGIERDVGTERGDEVDGDSAVVHEAPTSTSTSRPATRIVDDTGELLSARRL
jgi:hypothetical protein